MLILTIRTDKPKAEISLWSDTHELGVITWQAHRELSVTIHSKINQLLRHYHKTWQDITGVICFRGPGSFTGLRIGLTVGNALAYSLNVPIVATQKKNWKTTGISQLQKG